MQLISVIIPHAGGKDILRDCLQSLAKSTGVELDVILVDNSEVSDVDEELLAIVPSVQILRHECKIGFAGACNRGVEAARGDLVFLLNNDTVVESDAIQGLATAMAEHPRVGACQPKILSLAKPGYFDYASACGGELDRYGYPFARGRVFDHLEKDIGQHDEAREIFWGAGAALMMRRELFTRAGGLEESFFAHMEEIDLQWRFHLMGYSVMVFPTAKIYHKGAATLQTGSGLKLFLNHRNSLAMVFRNYSITSLIRFMPVRLALDGILFVYSLSRLEFIRMRAVLRAEVWFWLNLPYLIRQRSRVQKLRKVKERNILKKIFPKSVVWQSYLLGRKTWTELMRKNEV